MNPEEREELRQLVRSLKKRLPASAHKIRPLPGSDDLYIYIPWEEIRDFLDEAVPDYEIDFSDPIYSIEANLVSCKASISLMGVKKSAIASQRISIVSKKGNNAEIGNAMDRLHAEAFKNAAEAWGVGAYLRNQEEAYIYLWENQAQLDAEQRGKLQQMKVQFRAGLIASKQPPKPESTNMFPDVEDEKPVITDGQKRRLYAIAMKAFGNSKEEYNRFLKARGYKSDRDVLVKDYDALIQALEGMGKKNEVVAAPSLQVLNGGAKAKERVVAEAEPQQQIYPQHAALFAYFLDLFGVDKEAMPTWLESLFGKPDIGSLGLEQFRKAVREIAIAWAMSNECFVSRVAAEGSYDSVTAADAALGFGMKECIERWRFKALDNSRLATKR